MSVIGGKADISDARPLMTHSGHPHKQADSPRVDENTHPKSKRNQRLLGCVVAISFGITCWRRLGLTEMSPVKGRL